jgi:ribonuclease HI
MNNEIKIYTDGSSRGNPGPGGWGAIIQDDEEIFEIGGGDKRTTNNRMELTAIVETLEFLENKDKRGSKLRIYTDSSYVANGVSLWINGWRRNNWKNKAGQEIANIDLWQKIDDLLNVFQIQMENIEGHVGIPANERADEIATSFADGKGANLFVGKKMLYKINLEDKGQDDKMAQQKQRAGAKAYSYLSLVNGELQIHKTWDECKSRVDGIKGARYRKALSPEDENAIRKGWGI